MENYSKINFKQEKEVRNWLAILIMYWSGVRPSNVTMGPIQEYNERAILKGMNLKLINKLFFIKFMWSKTTQKGEVFYKAFNRCAIKELDVYYIFKLFFKLRKNNYKKYLNQYALTLSNSDLLSEIELNEFIKNIIGKSFSATGCRRGAAQDVAKIDKGLVNVIGNWRTKQTSDEYLFGNGAAIAANRALIINSNNILKN